MTDRPAYIIQIDGRGNYRRPRRVGVPLEIATGALEEASDLALTEVVRDCQAELERRRDGKAQ